MRKIRKILQVMAAFTTAAGCINLPVYGEDTAAAEADLPVQVNAEGFADSYELQAVEVQNEETLQQYQTVLADRQIVKAFTLDLVTGTMADEEQGVQVTLTLDDATALEADLSMDEIGLYHIQNFDNTRLDSQDDTVNTVEKLDYTYTAEAKTLSFTTKSFSPFILAYENEEDQAAESAVSEATAAPTAAASSEPTPTAEASTEPSAEVTASADTETAEAASEAAASSDPTASTEASAEPSAEATAASEATAEPSPQAETAVPSARRNAAMKKSAATAAIGTLKAQLVSGADQNENGDYVWEADTQYAGHGFIYRVSYALSGTGFYEPGEVEIRIPKSILIDRDGNPADTYEMSLPAEDDPDVTENTDFVYREDGDELVITNHREIPAATNGFFEISYDTEEPFVYADYGSEENDGSEVFSAVLTIGEQTASADASNVHIDTTAKVDHTSKECENFYTEWQSSWGEAPDDAEDYYYLVWSVTSHITATQPYSFTLDDDFSKYGEVVGYKYQGESTFSANKVLENQTLAYNYANWSSGRKDYVLTRIAKADYEELLEWKVRNDVTAEVTPADQVDGASQASGYDIYYYEQPEFTVPTGHFWRDKYGLDWNDEVARSSTDLRLYRTEVEDFNKGTSDTLGDFAYMTRVYGYPYPWTVDGDVNNPDDYGKKSVRYQITDDYISLGGSQYDPSTHTVLGKDDYDFTSIDLKLSINDAFYDTENMKFQSTGGVYRDTDIVTILVKKDGSEEYTEAGTYNFKTRTGTITDSDAIESFGTSLVSDGKVNVKFGKGIDGYRIYTDNSHYYTSLYAYPHITLFNTDTVKNYTEEHAQLVIVRNQMDAEVFDSTSASIFKGSRIASDYAGSDTYDTALRKISVYSQNNKSSRSVSVYWNVNLKESNARTGDAVEQSSGTFYDLLPEGASYENDSLKVWRNRNDYLEEGEYTLDVIENYRNSGRTMLKIQLQVPGDDYHLFYGTVHSYDALADYGKTVRNTIAYETGNQDIADGCADTPEGTGISEQDLMTDLDEATDDARFVYAENTYPISILTAANLGLYKKVKSAYDSTYVTSTHTNQNGEYSYVMRYANDAETSAKDLILFDSLENYVTNQGKSSEWHGILQSIDTSELEAKGIRPVVYYCTKDRSEIQAAYNEDKETISELFSPEALEDSTVWSTEAPADMSDVTAVAIDCRNDEDGNDFVLPEGESLKATLYMKAPAYVVSDTKIPSAYNNVYLYNTQIGGSGTGNTDLIHQDYTEITYKIASRLKLHKIDSSTGEAVQGIQFHLYGTSYYGTAVDSTKVTSALGNVDFKELERGEYTLEESRGVDDYQVLDFTMKVVVDEKGNVTVNGNAVDENDSFTISNEPRIHGDLEFNKRTCSNCDPMDPDAEAADKALAGAVFKLSGTSDYGNDIVMYSTSDNSGKVYFNNIERGTYTLKETEVPDGYIPAQTSWTVTCDENGNVLMDGDLQEYEGEYAIYNEPYHRFDLLKVNERSGEPAGGAEFTLTGTSDYGTAVNMTAASEADGILSFEELEPGTYVLQETKAPTYYMTTDDNGNTVKKEKAFRMDDTKRIVTITSDGKVTIDGLTLNEYGQFTVTNEEESLDIVKVTKKWNDGLTGEAADSRAFPNIHISTMNPNAEETSDSGTETGETSEPTAEPTEETPVKGTVEAAGTCGTVDWELDANGVLWLSGGKLASTSSSPWSSYASQIKSIRNDGTGTVQLNSSAHGLFGGLSNLEDISGLTDVDTSLTTDMDAMFIEDTKLTNIDSLKYWDVSNVTDFFQMFDGCSSLENVDAMADWDVSNVSDMALMFKYCTSLQNVNGLANWNTSSLAAMGSMFEHCTSLSDISGLKNWNVENVTSAFAFYYGAGMSMTFAECYALQDISPLAGWNMENVRYLFWTFAFSGITDATPLKNWNTSSVETMSNLFRGCSSLQKADFSGWSTESLTGEYRDDSSGSYKDNGEMFYGCSSLKQITLGPKFIFRYDTSWNLPNASSSFPYTGKWTHYNPYNHYQTKTARELMAASRNGEDVTGTWYWEQASDATHQYYCTDEGVDTDGNHNVYDPESGETLPDDYKKTGYWTKDSDDTWTYTFYVVNSDVQWYIWEDGMDGYTSDYTLEDITSDSEPLAKGTPLKVTNSTSDHQTGSLSLQKEVVNADGTDESYTSSSFLFTVTLTDSDGNALSGTDIYGSTVFKDGIAQVSLADDETVTFTDIPAGYHYVITEDTLNGLQQLSFTNDSGTIEGNQTVSAVCTNELPDIETNGFTLSKNCPEDTETAFTFHVSFTGLQPDTKYGYTDNEEAVSFISDEDGEAAVTVSLQDSESAVFTGLPVGSEYQITEDSNLLIASYQITDAAGVNKIAAAQRANDAVETSLTTEKETVDTDEKITVAFTNRKKKLEVPILKVDDQNEAVTGAELQVLDADGNAVETWTTSGDGSHTVKIAAGDYTLHESKVPQGYALASDIAFSVDEEGKITLSGSEETTETVMIIMTDPRLAQLPNTGFSNLLKVLGVISAVFAMCAWILCRDRKERKM